MRITNNTSTIRSLREDKTNRCLLGITPGQTRMYNNPHFDRQDDVRFWGFTGSKCEGNTLNTSWEGNGWAGPNSGNYLSTTIRNNGDLESAAGERNIDHELDSNESARTGRRPRC